MPTLTNPNRGSSYSAPRYSPPKVTLGARGGGLRPDIGKFEFGFEDKPEEVISAAGALTEAAVGFTAGVARSVPIFGKPVTDVVGGIATGISEIGFEGGPKVKDIANIPIKAAEGAANLALDALGFLGDVVERGIAQGRVASSSGDAMKDLPDDVKSAINKGDYVEAGNLLFKSGKTYGEGPWSVLLDFALDPLTYIPGAAVSKVVTAPFKAAASAAKFGIGATKAMKGEKLALELGQSIMKGAVNTNQWDRRIEIASGLSRTTQNGSVVKVGKQPVIDNMNQVLNGTVKAAAQKRYASELFIGAQETANTLIDRIAMTVGPKFITAEKEAKALPQLRRAFNEIFPESPEYVDEVIAKIRQGISEDDLLKIKRETATRLQNQNARREIAERSAANILKVKIETIANELRDPASKIIRDSMQDLDYLIDDVEEAERLVGNWISGGLNISVDEAKPLIDDIMASVRSGNRQDAIEALEFARQQGFGTYRREVVALRNSGGDFPEEIREAISRLTIASTRSLDDAVEASLKAEIDGATPDQIAGILRRYVNQYDELYYRFGKTPDEELNAARVLDYIKNSNVKITRIPANLVAKMPPAVQSMAAKLADGGYELSLAPRKGYQEVIDVVPSVDGLDTVTQLVTPFADLADDFPSRAALSTAESVTSRKSAMMRAFDTLSGSPSTRNITQRSYERFTLSAVNSGMSRGDARDVWVAVNNAARNQELSLRGLIGMTTIRKGKSSIDEIAKDTIGKEAYDRLARSGGAGYDDRVVLKFVLRSLNGDLSDIGVLPKISASVKNIEPRIMVLTDYIYPLVRFGALNPFFRLVLENIEPEFFRTLRGAYRDKRDLILDEAKSTIIARALVSERSVIREFGDAQAAYTRANLYATASIAKRNKGFLDKIEEAYRTSRRSIADVSGRKRRAFDAIVSKQAAINFSKDFGAQNPTLMKKLTEFYGTSDPYELAYQISIDMLMRDDPLVAVKYMDDLIGRTISTRMANASPEIKNAYYNAVEAYKYAYFKGAKVGGRSIYYADEVPFWVRSLNHPYLAIYPLSYMVTKVIPEFAEALFLKVPFVGAERIGVGYSVYENITEQLVMELEYGDGGLLEFFKENPDFAYFINMLFPGIPSQLGASIPANLRTNVVKPGLRGEEINLDRVIEGAGDQLFRGSVAGQLTSGMRAVEDFTEEITGADINLPFLGESDLSPSDAVEVKN